MATTANTPIKDPTVGTAGLLSQLLGQQGTNNSNTQSLISQLVSALQQGTTSGTSGSTNSSSTQVSAELAPLLQAFATSSQGMSPEQLSSLITGIFQEGAQKVPELTGAYANATGSRSTGNSGLQLALADLNRELSTAAATKLLDYNANSQRTATDAAAQIAQNTRNTQQQGQQQQQQQQTNQQTSQTQTGTAQTQQQQATTKQGVNPNMAALVGLGGTALNFADKKGLFDGLFGRGGGATGSPGTIAGGSSLVPTGGSTLANPLGSSASSGMLGGATPAASQGFLAAPAPAAPAGGGFSMPSSSMAGGGGAVAGFSPAVDAGSLSSGITNFGGFGGNGGSIGLGQASDFGFGSLPSNFSAFGTAGTEALGNNLSFGANPYSYGGSAGGITGAMGGGDGGFSDWFNSGVSGISSALGGATDWLGGVGDWIGSLFADGGIVPNPINRAALFPARFGGPNNFADGGVIANPNFGAGAFGSMLFPSRFGGARFADGGMVANPIAPSSVSPARFGGAGRFADGGGIGAAGDTRYGNTNGTVAPMPTFSPTTNIWDAVRSRNELSAGLRQPMQHLQVGSTPHFDASTPMPAVTAGGVAGLLPFLLQSALGFADGGQIDTGGGGPQRVRNQNYMGARPGQREQSEVLNYEGYASPAVGASTPAGGSPSLAAAAALPAVLSANMSSVASTPQTAGSGAINYSPEQIQVFRDQLAQMVAQQEQDRIAQAIRNQAASTQGGGSGGVGEGGAPTGSATDGIATGNIGQVGSAASTAIGLAGGLAPPALGFIAAMLAAISNQVSNAAGPANSAAMDTLMSGLSQSTANGGDGGVGGASTGEGGANASVGVGASTSADGSADAGSGAAGPGGSGGVGGSDWADGGKVRGPGTGTSDSIAVKSKHPGGPDISYSDGEFVIPTDTVNHFGDQFFQNLVDMTHTSVNR